MRGFGASPPSIALSCSRFTTFMVLLPDSRLGRHQCPEDCRSIYEFLSNRASRWVDEAESRQEHRSSRKSHSHQSGLHRPFECALSNVDCRGKMPNRIFKYDDVCRFAGCSCTASAHGHGHSASTLTLAVGAVGVVFGVAVWLAMAFVVVPMSASPLTPPAAWALRPRIAWCLKTHRLA